MGSTTPIPSDRQRHWDSAYKDRGAQGVSWFQPEPFQSLQMIHSLGISFNTPIIDIGGGASFLVDRLESTGYADITVLDISETALSEGKQRLANRRNLSWLHSDILSWKPERKYGLWHDRAVFHFLVDTADQGRYLETMFSSLSHGGFIIMATFAKDGPEYCSGLPVARYSKDELVDRLGSGFTLLEFKDEEHTTPSGGKQSFLWVAGRVNGG